MTSNLGSREIQNAGLVDTPIKEIVMDVLRSSFKPEFLNRIDDIVVFTQLSKVEITAIIEVQLERLRKNLADRGITITLEDSAKDLLVEQGYDPTFGARPLKRAIQTMIQNPLAMKLLSGEIVSGQSLRISAEDGHLKFLSDTSSATA